MSLKKEKMRHRRNILQHIMNWLKENTVDFVSFSYYSSRCASADASIDTTDGNVFATVKNPHLKASEWGWQSDPLGSEQ